MEKNSGKHVAELTISHIEAGSAITEGVDAKEIVVSNKAFELAKGWLRDMSKGDEEEEWEEEPVESEMRPSRLGLGATHVARPQVTHSMSALEKKLRLKLPSHREARKNNGNGKVFASQKNFERKKEEDDDDDVSEAMEDVEDSRTSAFQRKERPVADKFVLIKCDLNSAKSSKRKRK